MTSAERPLSDRDGPRDECGVFGVYAPGHDVARLDPTSKVKRGERAELWADTAKLHLFDPESGRALREATATAH